jgi:pimeloyl-ACP methyl ester carboxylesterase
MTTVDRRDVSIVTPDATLAGEVWLPPEAPGIVLFAHGSGSSRLSPRNRHVAAEIVAGGIGTLLFDLLTVAEERRDRLDASLRFDIGLLARRLVGATRWLEQQDWARPLTRGYFGASTGAAAALAASVECEVHAIVSRGGRPDLAGPALRRVTAPTLLIVGSHDPVVIDLNNRALAELTCEARLEIVPGATHLFEEPGTLEQVAALATEWFQRWL